MASYNFIKLFLKLSLFFSEVSSCWLDTLLEAVPGTLLYDMEFFATIVHSCKIWIWMLVVAGSINWPVYLISMFCSCSIFNCSS